MSIHLERLARVVDVEGREVLGQRQVSELTLDHRVRLVHHHHTEGLGPGQVQLQLQGRKYYFVPRLVKFCLFLDASRLYQVVAQLGETSNKINFNLNFSHGC